MSGQIPRKTQMTNPDLRRGQSEQTQQVKITDNWKTAHPDGFTAEIHQTSEDHLIPVLHKTFLEIEEASITWSKTKDYKDRKTKGQGLLQTWTEKILK